MSRFFPYRSNEPQLGTTDPEPYREPCINGKLSWYDKETILCKINDKPCFAQDGHNCDEYNNYLKEVLSKQLKGDKVSKNKNKE